MASDFSKRRPEEILQEDAAADYKENMDYFHVKLSELHHNIYFVQRILDFPLDIFTAPGEDYFLGFVVQNFLQISVLQITKLATDTGGKARTLKRFKNFMGTSVKEEHQADYRRLLKQAGFSPRVDALIKTAKLLRDKHIAHSEEFEEDIGPLTFAEIKEIIRELTSLFEVASFSTEYRYLMIPYDPIVLRARGTDPRPDIEKILDGVARDSSVLRLPETRAAAWPYSKGKWSEEKAKRFNTYRRKFGLPVLCRKPAVAQS
ncbi:MAG: hypothetical protein P4L85_02865 [Paludisphaera borealis]|uniref:hypothetical protein n=1 Tax=Paludisphaera borealis TaxID=1387353 RepID=UPI00284DAB57|nr:hypothetical protein [Paludisphaera borealis]MDR3618264.1 hypothetical protein [Paludisphaera borealis]